MNSYQFEKLTKFYDAIIRFFTLFLVILILNALFLSKPNNNEKNNLKNQIFRSAQLMNRLINRYIDDSFNIDMN